jgi:hypothetical protein
MSGPHRQLGKAGLVAQQMPDAQQLAEADPAGWASAASCCARDQAANRWAGFESSLNQGSRYG